MKETINFYYNLDIDSVEENDGKYHFIYNRRDYFFVFYNRLPDELEDILLCSKNMKEKGIDTHDILVNKDGSVLTKVSENNYILFSVNNSLEEFDIVDIMESNKKLILRNSDSSLYRNNWGELWSKKIDYFEYQIRELGIKKFIIKDSFSYYIGLSENAISYVIKTNEVFKKTEYDKITLSHRRIFYPNIKLNYLNPLSFIFDLEVRDIAEYLKSLFFSDTIELDPFEELEIYLKSTRLTIYEYQMLYARLLYPSYYFDIYEDVMNNDKDENLLIKIIEKADSYEQFLKKVYLEISKYTIIEKIDWIINLP
ncbi:MAG: hypothetical protein RSG95_01510 [Bacilli bacterium]